MANFRYSVGDPYALPDDQLRGNPTIRLDLNKNRNQGAGLTFAPEETPKYPLPPQPATTPAPPAATPPPAPAPSLVNSGRGSDAVGAPAGYKIDSYRVDAQGNPSFQKLDATSPSGSMRNIAAPKTQAELFADVQSDSAIGLIAAFNAAGALSANERNTAEFLQSENAARVTEGRTALEAEQVRSGMKRADEMQPLSMRALTAKTQQEEMQTKGAALQQNLTEKVLAGGEEGKNAAATLRALSGKTGASLKPSDTIAAGASSAGLKARELEMDPKKKDAAEKRAYDLYVNSVTKEEAARKSI